VELAVRAPGAAPAAMRIEVLPAEASSAQITADAGEREARVRALVRDRFGNALGASGFSLAARGASVGELAPTAAGHAEATLKADPRSRSADAEITAAGKVLARTTVRFEPPADAWLLFAGASGGAMSNGGTLRTARLGVEIGIRRQFGGIEAALLTGADAISFRGDIIGDVAGAAMTVSPLRHRPRAGPAGDVRLGERAEPGKRQGNADVARPGFPGARFARLQTRPLAGLGRRGLGHRAPPRFEPAARRDRGEIRLPGV